MLLFFLLPVSVCCWTEVASKGEEVLQSYIMEIETWACATMEIPVNHHWTRCDASSFVRFNSRTSAVRPFTTSAPPALSIPFLIGTIKGKTTHLDLFAGGHGVHVSKRGGVPGAALPPVGLGLQLCQWAGRTGPGGVQRCELKRLTFLLAHRLLPQSTKSCEEFVSWPARNWFLTLSSCVFTRVASFFSNKFS